MEARVAAPAKSVLIVADDLIWSSRLRAAVERADARAIVVSAPSSLPDGHATANAAGVLVDLNGRSYDGVEAVRAASATGLTVIGVGQHEDLELRRRALDAGAKRVFSYNKLFRDGPAVAAALIAGKL